MQSIDTTSGNPVRADKIGCPVALSCDRSDDVADGLVTSLCAKSEHCRHEAPRTNDPKTCQQAPGVQAEACALLPGAEALDAVERLARKAAEMAPAFDRRWPPLATVV